VTNAERDGGMMFVDNPSQTIVASNAKVTKSEALTGSGGVFYMKTAAAITITGSSGTSQFIEFKAPVEGSFMYSISPGMSITL